MARIEQARRLASPWSGLTAMQLHSARSFPRHSHALYGLGLIDAGAQRSASARGQVSASAGQLISVNAGEVHDGAALDQGGRSWRMLYFEPAWLDGLRAELWQRDLPAGRASELLTQPVFDNVAVRRALNVLWCSLGEQMPSLAADSALQGLLAVLLPCAGEMPARAPSSGDVRSGLLVQRARERLHAHDAHTKSAPDLATLAQDSGLSRYQFLRAFARHYGLPPHSYLQQLRLDRARRAIDAGLPLAEAADLAGFADQSHLNRLFKRHWGLTPGQYRAATAP